MINILENKTESKQGGLGLPSWRMKSSKLSLFSQGFIPQILNSSQIWGGRVLERVVGDLRGE
jgi:hypothetical protein